MNPDFEYAQSMFDLDGWVQISCADSDGMRSGKHPTSGFHDPDGNFGEPLQYTQWSGDDGKPVLRDYRQGDLVVCKHYVPTVAS